jgi:hypothetical protein
MPAVARSAAPSAYLLGRLSGLAGPAEQFYAKALEDQGIKPQAGQNWTVQKLRSRWRKGTTG